MKKPKALFRDIYHWYCGIRKTHNEKKANSDPEIQEYVRGKRKTKNLPDNRTDTKWLKKLSDKSWKTRCKKRKQYIKHDLSMKEERLLDVDNKMLQNLQFKYRDKKWHYIDSDCFGYISNMELRDEVDFIEKYAKLGYFDVKYKITSWKFNDFGQTIERTRKTIEYVRLK